MNEADFPSINLDELRLVPDWLREEGPPPSKQYAGHDGRADERPGERRGGGRFPDRGGDRRDARRPVGGGGPDRGRGRPNSSGSGGARGQNDRPERRNDDFRRNEGPATPPPQPAPVRIEFEPDDRCVASIVKQIRSTHLAYPLFGLARMFLQEPERHWLKLTLEPEAIAATAMQLFQLGEEGPVTIDRNVLEKIAFEETRERFYAEQTEVKEPIKGNYTNVARERQSGFLLGPTNYHGYQPALRALYESRFSRRMSFEDYRRNIEIVTDPAVVERWKEEARTVTRIVTREGEPPTVLPTLADTRVHFRANHLDGLIRFGTSFRLHGSVARKLPEPGVMQAIREAHEREMRYPGQFVQLLRQDLQNAGLHIFKHRKRVVYVSLARPTPFVADGAVSANVLAILDAIASTPLITRKALAARVFGGKMGADAPAMPPGDAPAVTEPQPDPASQAASPTAPADHAPPLADAAAEPAGDGDAVTVTGSEPTSTRAKEDPATKARAALAADVRFLVQAGHIIEFHNGTFDLPLPPKAKEEAEGAGRDGSAKTALKKSGSNESQVPVTSSAREQVAPVSELRAQSDHFASVPDVPAETEALEEEAPGSTLTEAPEPMVAEAPEPVTAEVSEPAAAEAPAIVGEMESVEAVTAGLPGVEPAREEPNESERHEPVTR